MRVHKNLVIVHGLLGSSDYFSPQKYLPDTLVHTPDLIGYGAKRKVSEEQTIDLNSQADEIARIIRDRIGEPTWLLGHSVGGAVAMLVAQRVPELVCGLISVEGNFTLNDAFLCSRIAAMSEEKWASEYRAMIDDPAGWLGSIEATDERVAWARAILKNQPYATIQDMARSVIRVTGAPSYLELVRAVIVDRAVPVYLVAGERSARRWDVPDWVVSAAKKYVVQPETGHMMMLENPAAFCEIVGAIMDTRGAK